MEAVLGLTWPVLLAVALVVLAAAITQGTLGFGFGLFALPFVGLLAPELLPQVLLMLGMSIAAWVAWRERDAIDWSRLRPLMPGRVLGVVPAAAIVAIASPQVLDAMFGTIGLLAVAIASRRGAPSLGRASTFGAGMLSGLMGTATGIGGPPLVAALRNLEGAPRRATLSATLFLGTVVSIVGLVVAGRFTGRDLLIGGVLLMPLLVGARVSTPLLGHIPERIGRVAVLGLCTAGSVGILVRAVTG